MVPLTQISVFPALMSALRDPRCSRIKALYCSKQRLPNQSTGYLSPKPHCSTSSPKPSNKIIRGLFPGPSTKHLQRQKAGGGQEASQVHAAVSPQTRLFWGAVLLQNKGPGPLVPGSLPPTPQRGSWLRSLNGA